MLLLSCFNRVWFFATAWTIVHQAPCPWDSPGKNTGVGWHALLQGIFLTQGSNLHLLYCRQFPYHWATGEAQARLIYQNKQWLKCSKSLFLTLIKYSGHKWLSWRQWFKDLVLSSLRVLHVPRPYHCLWSKWTGAKDVDLGPMVFFWKRAHWPQDKAEKTSKSLINS